MTITLGYDVSNVNGVVLPRGDGLQFRMAKASQGTSFSDRLFPGNRAAARRAGELFIAYHFLERGNGAAQADHFVNYVNASGGFSGIGAVLDVELQDSTTGPTYADVLAFGKQFARRVPGKPLVIYTGAWYWAGHLGNPTGLSKVPLWDASYVNGYGTPQEIMRNVTPGYFRPYGGWHKHTVRQFTAQATVAGHTPIDADEHEGTLETLKQALGLTAAPTPTHRPAPAPVTPKHPFHKLVVNGHFDRHTIDALQWWVRVHRDGLMGKQTTVALQHRVGTRPDGLWGTGTTRALQRWLNKYGRRWWHARVSVTGHLDAATVKLLQRYLNRLAGF